MSSRFALPHQLVGFVVHWHMPASHGKVNKERKACKLRVKAKRSRFSARKHGALLPSHNYWCNRADVLVFGIGAELWIVRPIKSTQKVTFILPVGTNFCSNCHRFFFLLISTSQCRTENLRKWLNINSAFGDNAGKTKAVEHYWYPSRQQCRFK